MIEQGLNYADSTIKEMTAFFDTSVENLERKEEKKIYSAAANKAKKSTKERKREDSDSSVIEPSKESTEACHLSKNYCILHGKCSHSTDTCKDLCAMVKSTNRRKRKISGTMEGTTKS